MSTIAIDYLVFGKPEINWYIYTPYFHFLKIYTKQYSDTKQANTRKDAQILHK